MHLAHLNGSPATPQRLAVRLAGNYGHFTSMLVRDGRVRGLGAHLDRLAHGNRVLFGVDLDVDLVRDYLRRAITAEGGQAGAVTARVAVLGDPAGSDTDVLVTLRPPGAARATAVRLRSVHHERTLPEIKHVGTFDLHHHARQARLAGFDDALFVTSRGHVSETSIRNIGFLDGDTENTGGTGYTVVWPQAPALAGVTQRLLTEALARRGVTTRTRPVPLPEVASMRGAFLCNAGNPVTPVAGIDDMAFPSEGASVSVAMAMLTEAYDSVPYEAV